MGAAHSIACRDCKKVYYLGYGSYTNFEVCHLPKFPAGEHEDHDYVKFTDDWTNMDYATGHLMRLSSMQDYDDLFIENFKEYEKIDVSGEN